jgi:peptidyl-prolyl cis-trans isomerase C
MMKRIGEEKNRGGLSMRKIFLVIMTIYISISFLTGCSSDNSDIDKRIIAQVNNYSMMVEDLRYELKNIPHDASSLLKTEEGRMEYMNTLLEKEILLQEAQRQGIDREKDFMKTIENYWEQALLRLLLKRKSQEILDSIGVHEEEIKEYYGNTGETLPLSEVRIDIEGVIRQEKETEAMNAWMEELKGRSYIRVNKDVLNEVLSDK